MQWREGGMQVCVRVRAVGQVWAEGEGVRAGQGRPGVVQGTVSFLRPILRPGWTAARVTASMIPSQGCNEHIRPYLRQATFGSQSLGRPASEKSGASAPSMSIFRKSTVVIRCFSIRYGMLSVGAGGRRWGGAGG